MRNFDERKAEIFRRSENRIKEGKRKRNRIIAGIIPIFVCITVLSVIYLPKINLFGTKGAYSEDIYMAGGSEVTTGFSYSSLEITENNAVADSTEIKTDKSDIESAYSFIQSMFSEEDDKETVVKDEYSKPAKGENSNKDTNYSSNKYQSYTKGGSYTITFKVGNGVNRAYTLDGNLLTNESTRQKMKLTDTQLLKLRGLLGLELDFKEDAK